MRTSIQWMTAAAVAAMMAFTANAVTVTVVVDGPGKVSPVGTVQVAAGKSVTLKATPDKDAVFFRWMPGSVMTPTLKVTPTADITYTAYFRTKASASVLPIIASLSSTETMVGVPFRATLPLSNNQAYPVKFSAKGLPKGLKIDANSGLITGVPTEAKTYPVTFTATSVANPKLVATRAFDITISPLPEKAQGTFSGYLDDLGGNFGSFTATVSAKGKVSAKAVTPYGTYTFSAPSWTSRSGNTFTAEAQTKKGQSLTLNVDASKAWNVNYGAEGSVSGAGIPAYDIYAQRNPFLDKKGTDHNAAIAELTAKYAGYYTVGLPFNGFGDRGQAIIGSGGIAPVGSGYLTLTVSGKGSAKAAGKMADGTSFSASVPFWVVGGNAWVDPYAPLYAKKGFAFCWMTISGASGAISGGGDWSYPGKSPAAKVPLTGDRFHVYIGSLYGAKYTPPPAGHTETIVFNVNNGNTFPFTGDSKGKYTLGGVLPAPFTGATLSLNPKTGVFTGKVSGVVDGKKVSYSHTGVRIQRTPAPGAPCGAGYVTLPSVKYGPYTLKYSLPVQLEYP
ncbi:MAG: Ig domain-containing protein [Kiritimatiellaeota bacterium]|nr:Ig domain-containing protein [Kiritimatiellota bacterium]